MKPRIQCVLAQWNPGFIAACRGTVRGPFLLHAVDTVNAAGAERHHADTAPATGARVDRRRRHLASAIASTVPSRREYIGPMTSEAGGAMPSRRLALVHPAELKAALADGVHAQHEAGDRQASRDSFERAYRLAERAGDAESMALAALGLAG